MIRLVKIRKIFRRFSEELAGDVYVRSVGGMRLAKARRTQKFRNGMTMKDVGEIGEKVAIHWTDPAYIMLSKQPTRDDLFIIIPFFIYIYK